MTSQPTIISSDHTSFRPALFTLFFMYLKLLCANFEPCHVMAYKNKFENIEATSGQKKVWPDSDFGRYNGELRRHLWCGRETGVMCLPSPPSVEDLLFNPLIPN